MQLMYPLSDAWHMEQKEFFFFCIQCIEQYIRIFEACGITCMPY